MPRPRKTDADRRAEIFLRNYRVGKARIGFQEPDIARALGISESTLRRRKTKPNEFSLGQVATLSRLFGWTQAEMMAIVEGKEEAKT